MSNDSKNYVSHGTLIILLAILGGLLMIMWNTITKTQDDVSSIKSDVAVIKSKLDIQASLTNNNLDKMFSAK